MSLDTAELDLYTDMCQRSQYMSHGEVFEPDYHNVSCKVRAPLRHEDRNVNLRLFGRKIFGEENLKEVNRFTRRTHKQEFMAENDVNIRGALKKQSMSKILRHGDMDSFMSSSSTCSNSGSMCHHNIPKKEISNNLRNDGEKDHQDDIVANFTDFSSSSAAVGEGGGDNNC
jgi:hypothetical protein